MFLRKLLLIVAAIAGVAIAFAPTGASARGGRGGGGRGGGRGVYRGGGRGFVRGGVGLGLVGVGVVGATCWRTVPVATPYGPRYRRVWVCD
jgi:hypothetical protein